MPKVSGRWAAIFALISAAILLFVTIAFGLRVPATTHLDPFGSSSELDYRALRFGQFAPLRNEFIAHELGNVIETRGQSNPPGRRIRPLAAPASDVVRPLLVTHPFTNDDFEDAYSVSAVPFTAKTNTSGATKQSGEPTPCAPVGGTAWYRYRAPASIGLIANTFGSSYATALGVFTGTDRQNIRRIGCNTSTGGFAQVAFAAKAGTTYWFQITGPVGGGNLVFNLILQGITSRASLASSGAEGDSDALLPAISADGRYLSFYSGSRTYTPDTPPPPPCVPTTFFDLCRPALFLRDRVRHRVGRVDVGSPPELPSPQTPTEDVSITGAMSSDGRYIGFYSTHADLVPDDTNETWDVFIRDQRSGRFRLVSVSSEGEQGNMASYNASLSADGRYMAFTSNADNLVPNDNNVSPDVFVHDVKTGRTTRVSVSTSGAEGNQARSDSFAAESGSHLISMSTNGRFFVFRSVASNLVPGDTNNVADFFLHDIKKKTTVRVSVSSGEQQGNADCRQPLGFAPPSVSDDGRYVFFNSDASNLVPGDTNGTEDVFVRDIVAGTTRRISVSSSGAEADRGVGDQDPIQIFRNIGLNLFVDPVNGTQLSYAATPDAQFLAFSSDATNLVPGDTNGVTDVFLRHLPSRTTTLISVASSGEQGDGPSNAPVLSDDGRFIAFQSAAANLVKGDTNDAEDIFVNELPRSGRLTGWG